MSRLNCRRRFTLLAIGFAVLAVTTTLHSISWPNTPSSEPQRWVLEALDENAAVAALAVESLRNMGPRGLEVFASKYGAQLALLREKPACLSKPGSIERRLTDAVDSIAGQRDAGNSGLYWYTDFDAAFAAAKKDGKPILSLRLLGKLTDELSCANSRFFRVTLYADPEVASVLRSDFILHWQSVRPAPKITIDFGDGRRIERTITGNSAHYVLDCDGRVVDVLPGLYSPRAFSQGLHQAMEVAKKLNAFGWPKRNAILAEYHAENAARLEREIGEMAASGVNGLPSFSADLGIPFPKTSFEEKPIRTVTPAAMPDIPAQTATVRSTANDSQASNLGVSLGHRVFTHDQLVMLSGKFAKETVLSDESVRIIKAKLASIPDDCLTDSRNALENKVLTNLREGIAIETARNEYDFHLRVHQWLFSDANVDLERLNDRVYAELFQAPGSDRWMGLLNLEFFSAIDGWGVVIKP